MNPIWNNPDFTLGPEQIPALRAEINDLKCSPEYPLLHNMLTGIEKLLDEQHLTLADKEAADMRALCWGVTTADEVMAGTAPYIPPFGRDQSEKLDTGAIFVDGKPYLRDAKGRLVELEQVPAAQQLENEVCRKITGYALQLSAQVSRFRSHSEADIADFEALLDQEHGVSKRTEKGNLRLYSFDGLLRVSLESSDLIDFGPGISSAKALIDECLTEWSANADPNLRSVVSDAFRVDDQGRYNHDEIYKLLKTDRDDPRWVKAKSIITEAKKTVGSKTYVRCHHRKTTSEGWTLITTDLAKA